MDDAPLATTSSRTVLPRQAHRRALRAYWWAPSRSPRDLLPELRHGGGAWWRLPARHGRPFRNFGDELARFALESATGRPVRWSPVDRADVVAVGSVLGLRIDRGGASLVWGSGLADAEGLDPAAVATLRPYVCAVRGPHTLSALGLDGTTPQGDPGVVASDALAVRAAARRGVLVIPHFRTWATAEGRAALRRLHAHGVALVPPTTPAPRLVELVARADAVVSSSMHGLVVAHTLGARAVPLRRSPGGPPFKHRDYYASIGLVPEYVTVDDVLRPGGLAEALARRDAEVGVALEATGRQIAALREAARGLVP